MNLRVERNPQNPLLGNLRNLYELLKKITQEPKKLKEDCKDG